MMNRHGPAQIGWMRTLTFAREKEREFNELLERALRARGKPKDVKLWAERLAADVADLTD